MLDGATSEVTSRVSHRGDESVELIGGNCFCFSNRSLELFCCCSEFFV